MSYRESEADVERATGAMSAKHVIECICEHCYEERLKPIAQLEARAENAERERDEARATIERIKALVPFAGTVSADELEACLEA